MRTTVMRECEAICREFIDEELPEMVLENIARYLAANIRRDLAGIVPDDDGYRLSDERTPFQRARITDGSEEGADILMGVNLTREGTAEAVRELAASELRERCLVYLFSFDMAVGEEGIAEAVMEPEMLHLIRDTSITAFCAVLDAKGGMGLLARIDGDARIVEYLPH